MTPEQRAEIRAAIDKRRRELTGRPNKVITREGFPHGTATGYRYGCRCDPCKTAGKKARARWKAKA